MTHSSSTAKVRVLPNTLSSAPTLPPLPPSDDRTLTITITAQLPRSLEPSPLVYEMIKLLTSGRLATRTTSEQIALAPVPAVKPARTPRSKPQKQQRVVHRYATCAVPRLATLRIQAGLSQHALSCAAGLSTWTIGHAERGMKIMPATAKKLADALHVKLADLAEKPPVSTGKGERKSHGKTQACHHRSH